ncbi:MAG: glycosyltransferase family 1 protein [Actinomycetes bacterium]
MKVGVIAEQLRQEVPGGIGTYLTGLLRGLEELHAPDIEVIVLASRPHGDEPLAASGNRIYTSRYSHRLQMALWDQGWATPKIPLDILHLTSLAGPITSKNSPPRSVMIHDLSWRHYPELTTRRGERWHEAAFQRVMASPCRILTTSKNVANELLETGISQDRISTVGAGSDHLKVADRGKAQSLLDQLGIRGEFVLTVSTLEPRKNLPRLIEAHHLATKDIDRRVPLLIVGPTGWGPNVRSDPHAILAGRQPDEVLAGLYELAACFAYVPLLEGFGLPPLEAMTHGAPVIVSTTTPSTERATHCWKVDPLDITGMATAIHTALEDSDARTRISAGGREYAKKHRWVDVASAHVEVWRTMT